MSDEGFTRLSSTIKLLLMNTPGCASFRSSLRNSRREFLRVGALGAGSAFGLSLPEVLRAESSQRGGPTDTSVIILWMRGGPSHIDMWDMKPDAPAEFRGE